MISGIIKVEADYTCRNLDYWISQKPNPIIVLLYIVLWKIYKNYCVKCKNKGKHTRRPHHSKPFNCSNICFATLVLLFVFSASLSSKSFPISVSEDEENLAIVRVVWAVQSCHLSTQFSRSLFFFCNLFIFIFILPQTCYST